MSQNWKIRAAGADVDTSIHPGDQRDPLGRAFAGSLATHVGMAAAVIALGTFNLADRWGAQHPSSGSVGVTMVSTIPIPRHEGPVNPVANDTQSAVPTAPAKQTAEKRPVPDKNAIEIPDKMKKQAPRPLHQQQYTPPAPQNPATPGPQFLARLAHRPCKADAA